VKGLAHEPTASLATAGAAARLYAAALLLSLATIIGITYGVMARVLGGLGPSRMAQNILAHETSFRVGIAGNLLYTVELLVLAAAVYVVLRAVDPLLALLAAIAVPSFMNARTKSMQSSCMNNLRQLQMGWFMYVQDNSDYLPGPCWLGMFFTYNTSYE